LGGACCPLLPGRSDQGKDAVRLQAHRQTARNDIHPQAYIMSQPRTPQSEWEDSFNRIITTTISHVYSSPNVIINIISIIFPYR
jgi:hypothetical protein